MMKPGVYPGIPEDAYHADDALSASGAKLLVKAPAKYLDEIVNPRPTTKALDHGSLCHTMVLGVGAPLVVLNPAVHGLKADGTPSDKPTATGMWKAADADARANGALPVHVDLHDKAKAMASALMDHPRVAELFAEGDAETSLWAEHPSGVIMRARPDWMAFRDGRVVLVDYKTTEDADPRVWKRQAHKYGYHIQRAWYRQVAQLLGVDDDPEFLFVVQEKTSPYLSSVIRLDPWACALGESKADEAITTYLHCHATGRWPGYGDDIHEVGFPGYVYGENTTPSEE